jgi:hypothetical protein
MAEPESVLLIGEVGAGKSTIANLIHCNLIFNIDTNNNNKWIPVNENLIRQLFRMPGNSFPIGDTSWKSTTKYINRQNAPNVFVYDSPGFITINDRGYRDAVRFIQKIKNINNRSRILVVIKYEQLNYNDRIFEDYALFINNSIRTERYSFMKLIITGSLLDEGEKHEIQTSFSQKLSTILNIQNIPTIYISCFYNTQEIDSQRRHFNNISIELRRFIDIM